MKIWTVIFIIGIVTLLERSSFILWFSQWQMPDWLLRALNFVPAAVFSALIAPAILRTDNSLDISLLNPKLLAACVAGVVAWHYRAILPTIVSGMVALWVVTWALPLVLP